VALAFVPSSLMLGVTTFVTTDMVSIPLLWIIRCRSIWLPYHVFARSPPGSPGHVAADAVAVLLIAL